MSAYCLIHGTGHGPEGWTALVRELESRGHRVVLPELPIERPEASATAYADAVAAALREAGAPPGETIALAHSAAGLFLPLVPSRYAVERIVFLAALLPRPGVSFIDQMEADPPVFEPDWVGKDPIEDEVALRFLFHDCPEERRDWALSVRSPFVPRRVYQELCPLETWPEVPISYVACAEDRTIAPAWQRRAARRRLGVEPVVISGGHCPQICRPKELVDLLVELTG